MTSKNRRQNRDISNLTRNPTGNQQNPPDAMDTIAQTHRALSAYRDLSVTPETRPHTLLAGGADGGFWDRTSRRTAALSTQSRMDHNTAAKQKGVTRAMCFANDLAEPARQWISNVDMAFYRRTPSGRRQAEQFMEQYNSARYINQGNPGEPSINLTQEMLDELVKGQDEDRARQHEQTPVEQLAADYTQANPEDWEPLSANMNETASDIRQLGQYLTMLGLLEERPERIRQGLDTIAMSMTALSDTLLNDSNMPAQPPAPVDDGQAAAPARLNYIRTLEARFVPAAPDRRPVAEFLAEALVSRDNRAIAKQNMNHIAQIDPHKVGGMAYVMREISDDALRLRDGSMGHRAIQALTQKDRLATDQIYLTMQQFQACLQAIALVYQDEPTAYVDQVRQTRGYIMNQLRGRKNTGAQPDALAAAIRDMKDMADSEPGPEANLGQTELRKEIADHAAGHLEQAAASAASEDGNVSEDNFLYSENRLNYHLSEASKLIALTQEDRIERAQQEAVKHPGPASAGDDR